LIQHKTYLKLSSSSAKDLTAIMTDYYKGINLEKQRQLLAQSNTNATAKEEFHCSENIKSIKVPKRQAGTIGRPGYSSSSVENSEMIEEESQEDLED
jgi:hypothetical protein